MNKKILKSIRIIIPIIILNLSNLFSQNCYIKSGQRWQGNSVTYHINSNLGNAFATQQQYETAIDAAASSWSGAGSVFRFNKGDDVNYLRGQEPSGIYQVGNYNTTEPGPSGYPPAATTDYVYDGTINYLLKDCSYFNTYYNFSITPDYTEFDIQSVILHEFGHWLRLKDETDPGCSDNVMYWGLTYHQIKQNLTTDDENGIINIYGQDGISQLKLNPFLSDSHYFFNYDPKVLFYINSESINKGKPSKTNLPKNQENKLFTTPKPETYRVELKK